MFTLVFIGQRSEIFSSTPSVSAYSHFSSRSKTLCDQRRFLERCNLRRLVRQSVVSRYLALELIFQEMCFDIEELNLTCESFADLKKAIRIP